MKKPLHLVPMRLQRMRIRLQRYNVTVQYKPGKSISVADTLSRNGARDGSAPDGLGLDVYVDAILKQMPVPDEKLEQIRNASKDDSESQDSKACSTRVAKFTERRASNNSSVLELSRRDHRN